MKEEKRRIVRRLISLGNRLMLFMQRIEEHLENHPDEGSFVIAEIPVDPKGTERELYTLGSRAAALRLVNLLNEQAFATEVSGGVPSIYFDMYPDPGSRPPRHVAEETGKGLSPNEEDFADDYEREQLARLKPGEAPRGRAPGLRPRPQHKRPHFPNPLVSAAVFGAASGYISEMVRRNQPQPVRDHDTTRVWVEGKIDPMKSLEARIAKAKECAALPDGPCEACAHFLDPTNFPAVDRDKDRGDKD